MTSKFKVIFLSALAAVLVLTGLIYYRYAFVFGDGVKAGQLNQIVYKGVLFKTYEGRIIQSGFKSVARVGAMSDSELGSYVFDFSVTDPEVADQLMHCSGKTVELHYVEYKGTLPWRGMQRHIVDKVLSVKDSE